MDRGRSRSPGRHTRAQSPGRHTRAQSPGRHTRAQSPGRHARAQSPVRHTRAQSPGRHSRAQTSVHHIRTQSPGRHARSQSPGRQRTRSPGRSDITLSSKHTMEELSREYFSDEHIRPGRGRTSSRYKASTAGASHDRHDGRSRGVTKAGSAPRDRRYVPRHHHEEAGIRFYNEATLDEETTSARVEVLSIATHVFIMAAMLMVTVPMAQVAIRWQYTRNKCPLFVHNTPEIDVYWGSENMAPCNVTAFLPLAVMVMSLALMLFHCSILHAWRIQGDPPSTMFTSKYAGAIMATTAVQTALALAVACTLTDGFRQTCLSFELNPYPDVRPRNCKAGYDGRDFAYLLSDLHTHTKILVGMAGAWLGTIAALFLTIIYLIRSKLCSCLMCDL